MRAEKIKLKKDKENKFVLVPDCELDNLKDDSNDDARSVDSLSTVIIHDDY